MKQNSKILLVLVALLALGIVAAALIHSPATPALLAHLHGVGPTGPVGSEDSGVSDASRRALAGVAAIGRRWDEAAFAETVSLYAEVHRDLEWPGLLDSETISYGPAEQQNFELFRPEQEFSEPGPVFVFVHGNGLGARDWRYPESEDLLLTHLGRLAATFGGIGVLMNYRTGSLADAYSGAEDLRLVVGWLQDKIAPYGGDPETIVVLGHSEGATLTATYLFDEDSQPGSGPGIAAAFLSSGSYGEAAPHMPALVDDYSGQYVPLALWIAEFDTPDVAADNESFHQQLCRKLDECPWYVQLDGYNHVSQLLSLGTDDTAVMNAFIRFYHTVR